MRHVVGGRANQPEKHAASTSEVGRFETDTLSTQCNLTALMKLSGQWIDQVHRRKLLKQRILDMDSSVSETYGRQQGTAYNGHFECLCYHPLFLFNPFGDWERVLLRRGNKASAKYGRRVLLPVIERYRHLNIPKFFRGDAAFAIPRVVRLPRSRAVFLHDPTEVQRRGGVRAKTLGAGNCELTHPTGRTTLPPAQGVLSPLPLPSRFLGSIAESGGQD